MILRFWRWYDSLNDLVRLLLLLGFMSPLLIWMENSLLGAKIGGILLFVIVTTRWWVLIRSQKIS